eukprot:410727_1
MKFIVMAIIVFGLVNGGNMLTTYYANGGDCVNEKQVEIEGCELSSSGCYGVMHCECVAGMHKKLKIDYYTADDCSTGGIKGHGAVMANGECNYGSAECDGIDFGGSWRIEENDWEQ